MSILKRRFRSWWQPPHRAGERIEYRQVTFLELFYSHHAPQPNFKTVFKLLLLMPIFFGIRVWVGTIGTVDTASEEMEVE